MSQNNDFDLDSFMEDAGIAEPGTKRAVKTETAFRINENEAHEDVNIDDLSDGWVPDEALDALIDEKIKNPNQTYAAMVQKELERNAPVVAKSLVRLATHSKSEATRLQAGKYILDKVLENKAGSATPMADLFDEITDYANEVNMTKGDSTVPTQKGAA